jgi:soluble lytic murein transglycosylase-like protein
LWPLKDSGGNKGVMGDQLHHRANIGFRRAPVVLAALLVFAAPGTAPALDTGTGLDAARSAALPRPLSNADADRYRRIFAVQENGRWRDADREIAKLENRLLLGHVLSQRYMHPTRYRSKFRELAAWLELYNDHPDARRIYRLAKRRKPRRAKYPRAPERLAAPAPKARETVERISTNGKTRRARSLMRRIRHMVRHERLSAAEKLITSRQARGVLGKVPFDRSLSRIATGWFFYGADENALRLAGAAAERSGAVLPFAHWTAGLAAFRLGRFTDAARHFEGMASSGRTTGWNLSAAAFWAARANMLARNPERVHHWLNIAAGQERTFYGILARRILGLKSPLVWERLELRFERIDALAGNGRVRRALALVQVGERQRAERELRALAVIDDAETADILLAIADAAGLPALALAAARRLEARGGDAPASGLYPLPRWRPAGGFRLDRALIFAFMRQESAFKVRAKSRSGARGLMQLMPGTAGFIARKRFRGRNRNQLFDPEFNLSLGQKYLRYLIDHEAVQGGMFALAIAYNGGPGNLAKWQRRVFKRSADPLMFIESIPARETRNFVERVLANLWVYRERLNQPAPSLDAIAAGERPIYKSVDDTLVLQAADARN